MRRALPRSAKVDPTGGAERRPLSCFNYVSMGFDPLKCREKGLSDPPRPILESLQTIPKRGGLMLSGLRAPGGGWGGPSCRRRFREPTCSPHNLVTFQLLKNSRLSVCYLKKKKWAVLKRHHERMAGNHSHQLAVVSDGD